MSQNLPNMLDITIAKICEMVDVNTVEPIKIVMMAELTERATLTHLYMITLKRSSEI